MGERHSHAVIFSDLGNYRQICPITAYAFKGIAANIDQAADIAVNKVLILSDLVFRREAARYFVRAEFVRHFLRDLRI